MQEEKKLIRFLNKSNKQEIDLEENKKSVKKMQNLLNKCKYKEFYDIVQKERKFFLVDNEAKRRDFKDIQVSNVYDEN